MAQRGIVFDMDYTLIHPIIKFSDVFENFFKVPHDSVSEAWLGTIYKEPLAKGVDIVRNTFPGIEEVQEKAAAFGLEWAKAHEIYPGCVEFLSALKSNPKYKIGLLTNGPSDFQRVILEHLDLSKYFDVIVVSGDEDVGIRKPNLDVFRIMATKMQLPPESLFMVGDTKEKEILPALELGWGALWIKPDSVTREGEEIVSWENLLSTSHSMPNDPLSISWASIHVEPRVGGEASDASGILE